jgi:signal transduction histidine kinase
MNPRTTEQYEAGLEGLLLDTERMEELANRMLAVARLEEAPVNRTEATNLQTALDAVVARLRPLSELRQVALQVRTDSAGRVHMPAEDAELLCSNLIMNALQHSSPAGRVSAIVQSRNGAVELHVVDQGNGIPEASLPHVFERFYRADRSRSRNSGGAGLGLSICKAIVERANGTIRIQSEAGTGTEVTVSLPAAPA